MERKILGSNRARIPVNKSNANDIKFVNILPKKLKRTCDHLATRGPPAKVHIGTHHVVVRANSGRNEPNPTLRKRIYEFHCDGEEERINNVVIHGKLPKTEIEDDIEEMRKKFEHWDSDDYKENVATPTGEMKTFKGPKIWHIEAYIEQNVYDEDQEATTCADPLIVTAKYSYT